MSAGGEESSGGGPIAHLSRRWHLCASHRLHTELYDKERNREVFGKCNNAHGHGHNYVIEARFSGPVSAETGMVTNLADLDGFAARELIARFDHQNLNTLACFADTVSTTENLAMEVYRIFSAYPYARLELVRIEETSNNSFTYAGESADAGAPRFEDRGK